MRAKTFFKYSWLPTVLLMLILAGMEIYVNLRDDGFKGRSSEPNSEASSPPRDSKSGDSQDSGTEPGAQHSAPSLESPSVAQDSAGSPPNAEAAGIGGLEAPTIKALIDSGFTASEAEVIARSIEKSVLEADMESGVDSITLGIRAALKSLGLPMEREAAARAAQATAVDESGGSLSFQEWKVCLATKLARAPASECLSGIVADYEKEVAEAAPTDSLSLTLIDRLEPVTLKAIERAEKACKLSREEALKLLYINIFDC